VRGRRPIAISALAAAAAVVLQGGPPAAAVAPAPVIAQMVVFPGGNAVRKHVSTRALSVKVGGRLCRAGAGTALPALVRSHSGRVRLRDFGSCSNRAADASSLFVRGIGRYRNHGRDGWVYKVGKRAATAGAADPSGPFGSGRLKSKRRVTWFYCRLEADGCQRTLALRAKREPGGLALTVIGYDDEGRGVPEPGAIVFVDGAEHSAGPDGVAHVASPAGAHRVYAAKAGRVRSFSERVVVK
jgi:hypothetical protein